MLAEGMKRLKCSAPQASFLKGDGKCVRGGESKIFRVCEVNAWEAAAERLGQQAEALAEAARVPLGDGTASDTYGTSKGSSGRANKCVSQQLREHFLLSQLRWSQGTAHKRFCWLLILPNGFVSADSTASLVAQTR